MSEVPDAWEDEWSTVADAPKSSQESEQHPKKVSSKVTKAQKRAEQAEFNRQFWAEAEGPKQPNFFLESRNVVPLRQETKPPPILLSRNGPIVQSSRPLVEGIENLKINNKTETSWDDDEQKGQASSLAERQAAAAQDREARQRRYEERRSEIFGVEASAAAAAAAAAASRSGNTSPGSGTPPQSRSSTPSRGGRRGRGRGQAGQPRNQQPRQQQQQQQQQSQPQPQLLQQRPRELYDSSYSIKPDSIYVQRRDQGISQPRQDEIHPVRAPRGPDGTTGFASNHRMTTHTDSLADTS